MPQHPCDICRYEHTFAADHCGSCADNMREWNPEDGLRKINARRELAGVPPLDAQDLRSLIVWRSSLV